jgi:lysozyme
MQTSENGKSLIKSMEGFVNHVYNDNGSTAIAYGHRLLLGESFPGPITQEQGEEILEKDLPRFEAMVNARVPASCNQNQFDALVDFTYNVQNQPKSLEQLLSHGWDQIPTQLLRWDKKHLPDGTVVEDAGLKARRRREADLWSS